MYKRAIVIIAVIISILSLSACNKQDGTLSNQDSTYDSSAETVDTETVNSIKSGDGLTDEDNNNLILCRITQVDWTTQATDEKNILTNLEYTVYENRTIDINKTYTDKQSKKSYKIKKDELGFIENTVRELEKGKYDIEIQVGALPDGKQWTIETFDSYNNVAKNYTGSIDRVEKLNKILEIINKYDKDKENK